MLPSNHLQPQRNPVKYLYVVIWGGRKKGRKPYDWRSVAGATASDQTCSWSCCLMLCFPGNCRAWNHIFKRGLWFQNAFDTRRNSLQQAKIARQQSEDRLEGGNNYFVRHQRGVPGGESYRNQSTEFGDVFQSTVVVSQYLNDLMIELISMFRYLDMSNTHTYAHIYIYTNMIKYVYTLSIYLSIYIYIYMYIRIQPLCIYIYTYKTHIYTYICVEPVDHHVFCIGQQQDQKTGCCGRSSTTSTSLEPQRCWPHGQMHPTALEG